MSGQMSEYYSLIDAVNEAKTVEKHRMASARLYGWRARMLSLGRIWSGIDDDLHTMGKYGDDRPMCCGVLPDWEPSK